MAMEYLRARKNVDGFLSQVKAMQLDPGTLDYGKICKDVLNGKPSRELAYVVRRLAQQ